MQLINNYAKNKGWELLTLTGICLFLVTCGGVNTTQTTQPGDKNGRPEAKPVPVAVTHVRLGEAASYYVTTATLEAESHAQILSRTTGVIKRLQAEEGDTVETDQILLRLEDEQQQLDLKQSTLTVKRLETQYRRQQEMFDQGILSPQDYEQVVNDLDKARADEERARLNLAYTVIKAPFSGRIVRRYHDLGDHIPPGVMLFEIMDVNPLLARIHIPSNRMGKISRGQTIELKLDSTGDLLHGSLRLVSPIVDPNTGTVKVTAEINDYPENTRPGDFAEVQIVTDRRQNAMLVPSVAVFEEQGRHVLYVVNGNVANRHTVEVGFVEKGNTEILSGIDIDDFVVIKGQRNLREDMPVQVMSGRNDTRSAAGSSTNVEAAL